MERVRELIANGDLGRITNVRAVFFNGYASEPNGALSWRFKKDLAGSGALGDLLSHVVDLMQYVVGPITEVNGLLSTIHTQRPILPRTKRATMPKACLLREPPSRLPELPQTRWPAG